MGKWVDGLLIHFSIHPLSHSSTPSCLLPPASCLPTPASCLLTPFLLQLAKSSFPLLVGAECLMKFLAIKIGPESIRHVNFGIGHLPQQKSY